MIVFCHLLNDHSGSPRVLRATLRALDARRNGLLYVGSQGRGVLEEAGVRTRRYWYRRSHFKLVTLFTYFASQISLYRALARADDIPGDAVVFVNTLLPIGAMIWGRRTHRRVIVHLHEVSISPSVLRRLLTGVAARCADRLLYVSRDHRDRLPIKDVPAEIVHNPVDPAFRERAAALPDYAPRRSGVFEVLMLASLRGYKGVDEFMALAHTLRSREDIHFTLVLNADTVEVADFIAHYPDAVNVSVHSRTDDPASFYADADLVLNLSRVDQWVETFGLTLVEAMIFGVPVIAPPVGGPSEIITDGREGFLIDSRDGAALRSAVCELADNPARALAMSQAATRRVADFSFDSYAAQLRHVLSELDVAVPQAGPNS